MLERQILDDAMRRALALARRGPAIDQNPQVGCVVLDAEGRIVAEGWHRGSGSQHAEVDALARLSVEHRSRAAELTAVVTLEPCNHFGRTGPCAEALREAGIGSVAYALTDPGHASSGGSRTLAAAGVEVLGGVLESEARALLGPWLSRQGSARSTELSRPHVTVKWAQTLDGRAAAADGSSRWITGRAAREDVHRRRAAADAILIGTGTLYADNPSLTARNSDGGLLVAAEQQPVPVVLGRREVPVDARIRQHPALAARGLHQPWQFTGDAPAEDLAQLATFGVRRLFVEGGPAVASSFLAAGLVDEVLIYIAPALLGGPMLALGNIGVTSINDISRLRLVGIERLGNDLLWHGSLAETTRTSTESPAGHSAGALTGSSLQ